jgi:hypothetical protein
LHALLCGAIVLNRFEIHWIRLTKREIEVKT